MSTVAGPDFIALQVRDIERAAEFYERELGLTRDPDPRTPSCSPPSQSRLRSETAARNRSRQWKARPRRGAVAAGGRRPSPYDQSPSTA